ncbi:MAG: PD-(D/E)XK motif protein [Labedaea sp.]
MNPTAGERHLSPDGFDQYLNNRVPMSLPVPGTPAAGMFIEPITPELGLRIEVRAGVTAPATGLRNIVSRITARDGERYFEVVVTDAALFRDAYPILCSMVDRVQLAGFTPSAALRATLRKLSSLLRAPGSMSREREVGLFGELLVVGGLINTIGPRSAIQAWRGGQAEEHDFGLPELDLEVKTTSGERRTHWIESLTQLVPTMQRPLWLVSHQVTTAGAGDGKTLPALVDLLRGRLEIGEVRDGFENGLAGSGWEEAERDRLVTVWTRRTDSTAFAVVDEFPRLTPDSLRQDDVPFERILDVKYRIDLNGLTSHLPIPGVIATAVGFEG